MVKERDSFGGPTRLLRVSVAVKMTPFGTQPEEDRIIAKIGNVFPRLVGRNLDSQQMFLQFDIHVRNPRFDELVSVSQCTSFPSSSLLCQGSRPLSLLCCGLNFFEGLDSEPRNEVSSADIPWCIERFGHNCNQLGLSNSDWVSGSF